MCEGSVLIQCKDCKCNIDGDCFRFPPMPHFVGHTWYVKHPPIKMDGRGCFAGIKKES